MGRRKNSVEYTKPPYFRIEEKVWSKKSPFLSDSHQPASSEIAVASKEAAKPPGTGAGAGCRPGGGGGAEPTRLGGVQNKEKFWVKGNENHKDS